MKAKLRALGLKNYRGIGPEWQYMPRFEKFNFFIGANNAGKSAVLNFLNSQLSDGIRGISEKKLSPLERFDGGTKGPVGYAFGISREEAADNVLSKISNERLRASLKSFVLEIIDVYSKNGMLWLGGDIDGQKGLNFIDPPHEDDVARVRNPSEWQNLWGQLQGRSAGDFRAHWLPQTIEAIRAAQSLSIPQVNLIPAKRQIGPKSEGFEDYSGKGLIDRLAEAQSPDWNKREDRDLFDKINKFVGQVTGDANSRIEIPHNREQILVHMDGRILPLGSLGTGIHEIILIAAFCTLSEEKIVCIEEPEIHLHPLMQRRLIKFLGEHTSNQYFIATHSASFIDTAGAAIFHVLHDGEQARIRETILAADRYEICADLGCRASDIVQANAVIWVEGPSDRIYIRHWISSISPEFIEGIHYSIMFYGGRLLSHLGAEADEIDDFISLRALNRNAAIVMDSDKSSAGGKINETKERISAAFSGAQELAWVTAGREIENYVDPEILHQCLSEMYAGTYQEPDETGKYDHSLYFKRRLPKSQKDGPPQDSVVRTIDKVRLAKSVAKLPADLNRFDLNSRVSEIVALIRAANHYS